MRRQVPTGSTTVQRIMRRREFAFGVDSIRNGVAPDFDELGDDYWSYERGRLWASVAPRSMPLTINGKLNPKAIALYAAASKRRFII
jgi:hypothetical protein